MKTLWQAMYEATNTFITECWNSPKPLALTAIGTGVTMGGTAIGYGVFEIIKRRCPDKTTRLNHELQQAQIDQTQQRTEQEKEEHQRKMKQYDKKELDDELDTITQEDEKTGNSWDRFWYKFHWWKTEAEKNKEETIKKYREKQNEVKESSPKKDGSGGSTSKASDDSGDVGEDSSIITPPSVSSDSYWAKTLNACSSTMSYVRNVPGIKLVCAQAVAHPYVAAGTATVVGSTAAFLGVRKLWQRGSQQQKQEQALEDFVNTLKENHPEEYERWVQLYRENQMGSNLTANS